MVSEGWAMAYRRYSPDYIRQEDNGSRSKVGIWQGDFVAARAVSALSPCANGIWLAPPDEIVFEVAANVSRHSKTYRIYTQYQ